MSRASYRSRPEGKRIPLALVAEIHAPDLGVNEEYLRLEKIRLRF